MGRGYGITPPAYWLLAAWHWSETGKPAYRGRYEYAKGWLLFMIKAYLIWKWEQARWLKEHWVVGQKEKKKKKERDWGGETERRREERHLQIHTAGEVWRLECHSCLVTAVNGADWTSSGAKVSLTLETFCRLRRRFFILKPPWVILGPCRRLAREPRKTDFIALKKLPRAL